jgi:hypothetical protein
MEIQCPGCQQKFDAGETIGRQETCPGCQEDLHSCRWCRFYDATAYNECREPSAERVVDKEKSNFCDYFEWNQAGGSQESATDKAKEALDNLFKK